MEHFYEEACLIRCIYRYLRSELCKTKIGLNMIQMEAASVNLYRADSDWKYES